MPKLIENYHEFESGDEWGRCKVCGSQYHCAQCGGPTSSYGHSSRDDDGYFFSCQEPERHKRKMELANFKYRQKVKADYERVWGHESVAQSTDQEARQV